MNAISTPRASLSLIALIAHALALLLPPVIVRADPAAARPTDATAASSASTRVHYRTVGVDGLRVFYREAGPTDAPVVLLLHGFPASSFMYRDLIERLAGELHVIAPDYPGFGYSDAPPT